MLERKLFHTDVTPDGGTWITQIISTTEHLRLVVEDDNKARRIEVQFEAPRGFRVLDEGDLLEFWPECSSPEGWIFEILSGGWMELESTRKGFIAPEMCPNLIEYLITGEDDCVSVLAQNPPTIREAKGAEQASGGSRDNRRD